MRAFINNLPQKKLSEDFEHILGQHAGLILSRYTKTNVVGDAKKEKARRSILQAAIHASQDPSVVGLYKKAFERWKSLLPPNSQLVLELRQFSRLIHGLGEASVLETGLKLHHNYGMPIIAGSSLKGLASSFCHQVWGSAESEFQKGGQYQNLLFGNTDESGMLIFHDAWLVPQQGSSLVLDIITPHHNMVSKGSLPPTDFDSPVTNQFLSVKGKFLFAVTWQGCDSVHSRKWTRIGLRILGEALCHDDYGIGGKTSSGYGRFNEAEFKKSYNNLPPIDAIPPEEIQTDPVDPFMQSINNVLKSKTNPTEPDYSKILTELESSESRWQTKEERYMVATYIENLMKKTKVWTKNPKNKTDRVKKILKENAPEDNPAP